MFKLKVSDIRAFLKLTGVLKLCTPGGITFDCSEEIYIRNGCNQILEVIRYGGNTGYLLVGKNDSSRHMASDNSPNLTRVYGGNLILVHEDDDNKIAPQSLSNIITHSHPYLFNMDWIVGNDEMVSNVVNINDSKKDVIKSLSSQVEVVVFNWVLNQLTAAAQGYDLNKVPDKTERLKLILEDAQKTLDEMNAANVPDDLELSKIRFTHGLAKFYYLQYTRQVVDLPVLFELVDNIYTDAYVVLNWSFDDIEPILPYIGFFPRLGKKLLLLGDALPIDIFESLVRAKGYEENRIEFQHIANFLQKRGIEWQTELLSSTSLVLFLVQENYHGTLRQITRQNQPLKELYINTLITAPYISMMRYLVVFNNDLSARQKAELKVQLGMFQDYQKNQNQEGLIYHGLRMMINNPAPLGVLSKNQWQHLLASAEQNPVLKQLARLILPHLLPLEGDMHLTAEHMPFIVKALIDDEDDALVPHVQRLAWDGVINCAKNNLNISIHPHLRNLFSYVANQPPNPALAQFFIDTYGSEFSRDGYPSYMDVFVFAMACYLNPVKPYSLIFENVSVPEALPFLYPHAWVLNDAKDALISLLDIYDSVHEQLEKAIFPENMKIKYRAQNQDGNEEFRELTPPEQERVFKKLSQIKPSAITELLKQAVGKVPENMAQAIELLMVGLLAGGNGVLQDSCHSFL